MDCREFERLIPDFINQRLDFRTLQSFQAHINQCENCKEELVIQFLITEGLVRLEEGSAFDLQKELDKRLEEAQRRIKFHNSFLYVGVFFEAIAMLAIVGIVMWILI